MSSPQSKVYLVVGASRGIGQELATQLSANSSDQVIATVRKPVDFGKSNVRTLKLDQSDPTSVVEAATQVKEIDTLILNAAIGDDEKLLTTSGERLQNYLTTNVLGVHRVIAAFLPALKVKQTKQVVIISSTSGSLEKQRGAKLGFMGPYSVTKAANNMQVVQYHNELYEGGFTIIAMHPGWVSKLITRELGKSPSFSYSSPR